MDIIELMDKYSLVLRRVPEKEVSYVKDNGELVRVEKPTSGACWLVIRQRNSMATTFWHSKKDSFVGKTAEEAIKKAVNYYSKHD